MKEKPKDSWGCKFLITKNVETFTQACFAYREFNFPCEVIAYKNALEVGESGNLHLHFFVILARSWRLSGIISKNKGYDIKLVTPGTEQTVIQYVGDESKEGEKGAKIISVDTFGEIEKFQGQRNDMSATDGVLWQIKDAIDSGASTKEIWGNFFPYMVRYGSGIMSYKSAIGSFDKQKEPVKLANNVIDFPAIVNE